jgi:hypothetical protein
MSEPDFMATARKQLEDEDRAKFEARVKARARLIEEQHRQVVASDFKTDPAEAKAQLDRLIARRDELKGKPVDRGNPWMRTEFVAPVPRVQSAAEDDELRQVEGRIFELTKVCRRNGTLTETAA